MRKSVRNILVFGLITIFNQKAQANTNLYVGSNSVFHVNQTVVYVGGDLTVNGANAQLNNHGDLHCVSNLVSRGSLNILSLGSLSGDGTYHIDGDWHNDGLFNAQNSSVLLKGDTQYVKGANTSIFYDLSLQGTGVKHLQVNSGNTGVLDLNDLELSTNAHTFDVQSSLSNAILRSTGFVSSLNGGFLTRAITSNDTFLFPLGSRLGTQRYRPLEITSNDGSSQVVQARLANLNPSLEAFDVTALSDSICAVNPEFYHQIHRLSGNTPLTARLYYDQNQDFIPYTIAQFNSGDWKDIGVTSKNQTTSMHSIQYTQLNNFDTIAFALAAKSIQLNAALTQVLCNGDLSGAIDLTVTNGNPTYNINWQHGPNASNLSSLAAGNYLVTVSDAFGCEKSESYAITQPDVIEPNLTAQHVSCFGFNDAVVYSNVLGGNNTAYSYAWSNGASSDSIASIQAGSYTLSVTDANNCEVTDQIIVTQPDSLYFTSTVTTVGCFGDTTGAIQVAAIGGTPNYQYAWNNGQTSSSITGLSAGTYNLLLTDNNNCIASQNIDVAQPDLLQGITITRDNLCYGSNAEGSAIVVPTGGTAPFAFEWDSTIIPDYTSAAVQDLYAGIYVVSITDSNDCEATLSMEVKQPDSIAIAIDSIYPEDCGYNNGYLLASVSGGTAGYTYLWDDLAAQTNLAAENLQGGNYTFEITDGNNCVKTKTVELPTFYEAYLSSSIDSSFICEYDSAMLYLSSNGVVDDILWDNGHLLDTMKVFPDSSETQYIVTISNDRCTVTDTIDIDVRGLPYLSLDGDSILCDSSSGTMFASTNAVEYLWNTSDTTAQIDFNISALSVAELIVTVTDTNGCKQSNASNPVQMTVLPKPYAYIDTMLRGPWKDEFDFVDSISSDVEFMTWDFGDGWSLDNFSSPKHIYQDIGTYEVSLIAQNEFCADTAYLEVYVPEYLEIPNVFSPDGDGINDEFIVPSAGLKEYQLEIKNRWGETVFTSISNRISWDGRSKTGLVAPEGTYYYIFTALGSTQYSRSGHLTLMK